MSKDPAILFYTSDFLTGVADLTFEERGQYITLLCLQHQKGHLSGKAVAIAVPNATADVLAKFSIDSNGNYFNKRLEIEAKKRFEYSEKQKQRAIDGWKKRKKELNNIESHGNATAMPLENANESINDNEYRKFKHLSIAYSEIEKLKDKGFTIESIDEVLDKIENYKNNKKYNSLYLTSLNWLKKENKKINDYEI